MIQQLRSWGDSPWKMLKMYTKAIGFHTALSFTYIDRIHRSQNNTKHVQHSLHTCIKQNSESPPYRLPDVGHLAAYGDWLLVFTRAFHEARQAWEEQHHWHHPSTQRHL